IIVAAMGTTPKSRCVAIARRKELADFLRSRRARLGPEAVGLPNGFRRRTPGLRREEVAHLAGVGVTWYTWLEQGREIRAGCPAPTGTSSGSCSPTRRGAAC